MAAQYLRTLADTHGFTHVVETRRSSTETDPVMRPARGDGSLVLALFVQEVYHARTKDDPAHFGYVTITHVPTGTCVESMTHPFTTERSPDRPWLIPATPKGIACAEQLRQDLLALDVPWDDFPEDMASRLEIAPKVRAVEPSTPVAAKIERDALKLFRAELKSRTWPTYWTKTQIATVKRDLVRSRFFWTEKTRKLTARGRKALAEMK